jgi:hypothetical protein
LHVAGRTTCCCRPTTSKGQVNGGSGGSDPDHQDECGRVGAASASRAGRARPHRPEAQSGGSAVHHCPERAFMQFKAGKRLM